MNMHENNCIMNMHENRVFNMNMQIITRTNVHINVYTLCADINLCKICVYMYIHVYTKFILLVHVQLTLCTYTHKCSSSKYMFKNLQKSDQNHILHSFHQ